MLIIKRLVFFVLGLLTLALGAVTTKYVLDGEVLAALCVPGAFCLLCFICMVAIRAGTRCPQCNKVWVGKKVGDEDLGVCSNTFTRKDGDTYHTYEKHKHLESYRCTSCGHEWEKTVTREERLN